MSESEGHAEDRETRRYAEQARADRAVAEALKRRIAAEEERGRRAEYAAEAKAAAAAAAAERSAHEADYRVVREEREKAEARLRNLSARRWPLLLAVAAAVVLAFFLGLYVGGRQPAPEGAQGEPIRLRPAPELRAR